VSGGCLAIVGHRFRVETNGVWRSSDTGLANTQRILRRSVVGIEQ